MSKIRTLFMGVLELATRVRERRSDGEHRDDLLETMRPAPPANTLPKPEGPGRKSDDQSPFIYTIY
jgi:hypothetical protein